MPAHPQIKNAKACPKCGSGKFKEIIYGIVDPFDVKRDDILGGCVVSEKSPKYYCQNCRHKWGKITNFV